MTVHDTRRPLEETIYELVDGIIDLPALAPDMRLRIRHFELDVPLEASLTPGPAGPVLRADLPKTVTATRFDRPVGRLRLSVDSSLTESLP